MKLKQIVILLFIVGNVYGANSMTSMEMDTTVIEILDETLDQIYYHQENFTQPTRLVFPNLTTVLGIAYFHQNVNLLSVDFPQLNIVGDYVYFSGNETLEYVKAPTIDTIHNYLYVNGNNALTEFDFCSLISIYSQNFENPSEIPYYFISNNTPSVDAIPFCFSQGAPENLNLSNANIDENEPEGTYIGTLSATGNYPLNTFIYYLTEDGIDNDHFEIVNDSLRSKFAFDFEVKDEYVLTIGVFNQLGETHTGDFTISIEDIQNEGVQIIEILDDTLSQIYYHQEDFTQPTRLVFPNLSTVLGITYFHQNVNLLSVEFPQLKKVGEYVYFHENSVLEYVKAPVIDTIYNYLYANGNISLTEFDFCSLTVILPQSFQFPLEIPYYFIANNTPTVDATPFCFSQGAPENINLSNASLEENEPADTYIGTLSATGNYSVNTFNYYLTEDGIDNDHFEIVNDSLRSKSTFDFEVQDEYILTIGVFNQLGEMHTGDFTISIEDVQNEGVQIIEILDDTLSQIYYHQENFTQPTRLVFPNLTTVLGYTYFHQNVNLLSVDFPQLNKVGDYFYFHENLVLEYMKAPVIDTVYNYLYANGHANLTEFDVCSLSHIISDMVDFNSYYYLNNNPLLDLTTTCLDTSILQFVPMDSLLQAQYIQVGTFETGTSNDFLHYMEVGGVEVTETNEFIIINDGLYLTQDISYYDQNSYTIEISSYKLDDDLNSGVNERILSGIILDVADTPIITNLTNLEKIQDIQVYPNPTSSNITIVLEGKMNVKLINLLGSVVKQQTLSKGIHQIDLNEYGSGLYFINTEFGHSIKISKL